jgi:hypothetical protein
MAGKNGNSETRNYDAHESSENRQRSDGGELNLGILEEKRCQICGDPLIKVSSKRLMLMSLFLYFNYLLEFNRLAEFPVDTLSADFALTKGYKEPQSLLLWRKANY